MRLRSTDASDTFRVLLTVVDRMSRVLADELVAQVGRPLERYEILLILAGEGSMRPSELAQDRVMNGFAPEAIDIIQNWDVPNFPVTGQDLMNEGIPEGPELGQALDKLENWWIEEGFTPDKEACLEVL